MFAQISQQVAPFFSAASARWNIRRKQIGDQFGQVFFHAAVDRRCRYPSTRGLSRVLTQIQVPIPFGQDCDTDVVVQVGDATSQPGVTIAIDLCI